MLKLAFIGCIEFSHRMLDHILSHGDVRLVATVTRDSSPFNADFRSLADIAKVASSPVLAVGEDDAGIAGFLAENRPDVVLCIGWPRLLPGQVLEIPPLGAVGYHPAALPENRGRHPLIWALALGLGETASTFFMMDEGADTGDIVSQVPVPIRPEDDAGSLYDRMLEAARRQISPVLADLAAGRLERSPQPTGAGNTWRRRSEPDGAIDWRMTAPAIRNLVRALAPPYPGAHCRTGGSDVRVWRVEPGPAAPDNLEPGKVLAIEDRAIVVKCQDGSVRLTGHEFDPLPETGSYL